MFMILVIILTGGCVQKKNQLVVKQEENKKTNQTKEPVQLTEKEEEFYMELKKKLKNANIHSYESPKVVPYHDFTLENLKGESIALSDFKGHTILLNFWAIWCGPCRAEMPSMEKLYNELADDGIVLIAVNLGDSKSAVEEFVKKTNITFPILLDKTGEIGSIYGASSIPLSYLIDTEGYLVGGVLGTTVWNTKEIIEIVRFIQNKGNQ